MSRISSLILPLISSLVLTSVSQAADCSGDSGANPWISWAFDIRQAACGDGACQPQFDSEGTGACNLTMPIGGGWAIQWISTDSAGTYNTCWDASENIINQCFTTGTYTRSSHSSSGIWSSGSESYTLTISQSQELLTYNPNDYGLAGEGNDPPAFENPAPPVTTAVPAPITTTAAAPAPVETYTCGGNCRGYVPDGDWCAANCPCFNAHDVC